MTPRHPSGKQEPAPGLGLVLDFMRLLWQLDHSLQRMSKRMESTLGVTSPQRLVLRIVGRFPGMPAGHLANLLHLHPSTLTGVLQRLEGRGLLHRRPDPGDRRRQLLSLTSKGRLFDVSTEETVEAAIELALEAAPRAQIETTRALLESLSAQLASASEARKSPPIRRRTIR